MFWSLETATINKLYVFLSNKIDISHVHINNKIIKYQIKFDIFFRYIIYCRGVLRQQLASSNHLLFIALRLETAFVKKDIKLSYAEKVTMISIRHQYPWILNADSMQNFDQDSNF